MAPLKRSWTTWPIALFAVALLLLAAVEANATEGTTEEPSQNASNSSSTADEPEEDDDAAASGEDGYTSQVYAVLFPWFVQALGVVLYYLLTRGLHAVPYTALCFIVGTIMGAGATHAGLDDQLTQSITMWSSISHRVLFCTFLPGLLFKDALEINYHLFLASFWQVMYLAFPMVLAGTYLTALVGVYVFPYNWTMNTALTFGSILSATDPVAVCVLLNDVCAPPRLRMHISGEALWNDGSAVVFYSVFSTLFFYELNVGLGQEVNWGNGVAIFFRMSMGGVAVGLAFSLALIYILFKLNRRLSREETVLQVASTATVAYLTFYVCDVICKVSGVIGVVVHGTVTKAFGGSFINDWQVMDSFWSLLEHLLNTVLFALGGIEFGKIVGSTDASVWHASDWGYLFALYALINIIRFVSLFASYPLLAKIGLGTNWQETVFSGWAGLRGAVGITLALGLNNEVAAATDDPAKTDLSVKIFGMVGGVAFLTLIINGSLSGPLLARLGLVDTSDARKVILREAEASARRRLLGHFLRLMTDPRFTFVDFALVQHHCPLLANLTARELEDAVRENKESVNPKVYKQPNLSHVFPYIDGSASLGSSMDRMRREAVTGGEEGLADIEESFCSIEDVINAASSVEGSVIVNGESAEPIPGLVKDMRIMLVELLRCAYHAQIQGGELDAREYHGLLVRVLLQSLDFAQDAADNDVPLDDWRASQIASPALVEKVEDSFRRLCCFCWSPSTSRMDMNKSGIAPLTTLRDVSPLKYQLLRLDVLRAFAFIDAHREAQERLRVEFGKESGELYAAFQAMIAESNAQIRKAADTLRSTNKNDLKQVISHHLCMILQSKTARIFQQLLDTGVLSGREASEYLQDIDRHTIAIRECRLEKHPGTLEYATAADNEDRDSPHPSPRRRRQKKQKSLAYVERDPNTSTNNGFDNNGFDSN